jgi:hypothetical protein
MRLRTPRLVTGLDRLVLLIAFLLISSAGVLAAPASVDAVDVRTSAKFRSSGELTDEVWQRATAVTDFVQREPEEGVSPSQRTEFRVAYDAGTLYVRVRAFDTDPEKIVTFLTRRDDDSPCDWLRVFIDSYHDRRTAYEFAVNPSGIKQDRYWFDDTNNDNSWDAVWDVSVSRDGSGWAAEFRIPFSQLRFTPGPSTRFGFAVVREISRLKETVTWPLLARSANGYVSSFGEVGGLSMLASPRRLEVLPYTVASLTTQPSNGNPLVDGAAPEAAFGLDVKYAVTPGLTLTATINPDFGQIEADPAVVNLTAFETFYPEKRPFFVEGSGTFKFGLDCGESQCTGLFYSRRIGRPPQGVGDLPSGDYIYSNPPVLTTILSAAKVTGRVGRFSIGALHAITQEEQSPLMVGTTRSNYSVEPLTNYSVGRGRFEFANQSSIGFMLTSTRRQFSSSPRFLPETAVTGGADFDWRLAARYSLVGYWAGTYLRGEPEAIERIQENSSHYFQRPDSDALHLDPTLTSLDGSAARIAIRKIGGERVRFDSSAGFKSPGFDINDVGFLQRADLRMTQNWLQIRSERPSRWFRDRRINFNYWGRWNFDGDVLENSGNINAHATFVNNWRIGGGLNLNQRTFDDRLSRGGPGGLVEGFTGGWYYVQSDERRVISIGFSGNLGGDGHGSSDRAFEPSVTLRPIPALSARMGFRFSHVANDSQWVDQVTDSNVRYVFGRLRQTTASLTSRISYTISPRLSLQLYAEPFVSAGDYSAFKELVDGRNPEYTRRYVPFDFNGTNPDFNYRSFRTTNVLRWEYKPGSALFLVWQQARENTEQDGRYRFGSDMHDIFQIPAKNVLLVKFAYWLNY